MKYVIKALKGDNREKFLFGNQVFVPELRLARRFNSVSEAASHIHSWFGETVNHDGVGEGYAIRIVLG